MYWPSSRNLKHHEIIHHNLLGGFVLKVSIGIHDLQKVSYGGPPPPLTEDQVPVFWACGATIKESIKYSSKYFLSASYVSLLRCWFVYYIYETLIAVKTHFYWDVNLTILSLHSVETGCSPPPLILICILNSPPTPFVNWFLFPHSYLRIAS